jgi:hypothetical protein
MNDVVTAAGETTDATHLPNPNETAQGLNPAAEPERPEWLPEKFKTPEDMATSYNELQQKLMTKTEDLKNSLLEEITSTPKEGVPDAPDKYELPEGFDEASRETELWNTFTSWSHERQLTQDDFNELVGLYATALTPNLEAEKEKLGADADERLAALSQWVGVNVPDNIKPTIIGMATTAENIQALETLMKLTVPQKLPGDVDTPAGSTEAVNEGDIHALMMSKEYLDPLHRNPEVVKKVDAFFAAKYNS